ncbi:MAG: S41 family peptidase [Acidobacteria bacterium]|nr:S41 family peptidase [Acidobacteriota bacterium]
MSEKIYALLLRLQARRFRDEHGEDAMQLFRDRLRDETGFWRRCRLWWDLLLDLAVSAWRGYQGSAVAATAGGEPFFTLVASDPPRRSALFAGGMCSLAMLLAFPLTIGKGARLRDGGGAFGGPGQGIALSNGQGKMMAPDRAVRAVMETMRRDYPDPKVQAAVTVALKDLEESGALARVTSDEELSRLLSSAVREASGDNNLDVVVTEELGIPPVSRDDCGFERLEILAGNIGFVKLSRFARLETCRVAAASAMDYLNQVDALVMDLRDNRGGYPDMVMWMAAYLFHHPQFIYNPRESTTRASWTASPVKGNKLADKPVYLLVSSRTESAAEQFAYNMKMLRRAALVGGTTSGKTHAGVFAPQVAPINPYGEKDWDGVGVSPHVQVEEGKAMERALRLAWSRLGL